jgi:uncharacterized Zn finger protein
MPAEVVIRFKGNPPITAERYERELLRCDTCGQVYKAELPEKRRILGGNSYRAVV